MRSLFRNNRGSFFVFTLGILSAAFAHAESTIGELYKIGVVLPLSGDVAAWGEDVRDTLVFANQVAFANKFQFIFEDDRCRGKDAATATSKLLNIDKVRYGMTVCTESLLSSAPLFEARKTLVITPVCTGAQVSHAGDYIFRTWPSDAAAAEMLYQYVSTRHNKIGILSEEHGYSQELRKSFLDAAHASKLSLIDTSYTSGTTDFRPLLLKFKTQKVEAIFVNPDGPTPLLAMLKQIKELQINAPIYGVYMPGNKVFLDAAGNLSEGIIYVDGPALESILNKEGAELYKEYQLKYGALKSAPFIFAATFEALHLFDYLNKNVSVDGRQLLYSGKFEGIFGPYSFDSNGDIVGVKHTLKIVHAGKPEILN